MNGPSRTLVIATAGHIDHGKTTLVRALTGIDADRLPEEKRRGITIDLGFPSMELSQPDGAPLSLSFVDVPGHALFIRNMLAGAGCVPAVMLVVAADEGIKPQTVEHLAICELLGIPHGVIALTKIDAADRERLNAVIGNVRALTKDTFLKSAPIVPLSAQSGEGIPALRDELINLASRAHTAASDSPLRMPLDRSFVMKGFGTVVTGTLLSGAIQEGQSLVLEPGARGVRVRGLQTHGKAERSAQAGTRVAVNLAGIDASDVQRGQTLLSPNTLKAVDIVDAEVMLLPGAPPLRHRARVHFHAFTSEVMATVSVYGNDAVHPGTPRLARLKLEQPVVLVPSDRFVLRQPAPVATIGGGRVLDCYPEPRQRKAATAAWLEELRNAPPPAQLVLRVNRREASGIGMEALTREAGLTPEATRRHLDTAIKAGEIVPVGLGLLASREALDTAQRQLANLLQQLQERYRAGSIKASELRGQARLLPEIFDFLVRRLASERKVRESGEMIALDGFGPASNAEANRMAAIAQAYETAGLAAPLVPELAQRLSLAPAELRRLITLLQRQKTIVRMGSDDLFMHSGALDKLRSRLAPLRGTRIDVATFKQFTGLSRKYAIPLLEYLDHARLTRKEGEQRLVL